MGSSAPSERAALRWAAGGGAAFSLIELLVVMMIVAILAGLLLPAVRTVKEVAARTKCQASLRQVGFAMFGYLSDNEGMLPPVNDHSRSPPTEWLSLISPYAEAERFGGGAPGWGTYASGTVLTGCPKLKVTWSGPNRGYAMNRGLIPGGNDETPVAFAQLTYPCSRLLVSERTGDNMVWGEVSMDFTRHNQRANALMCDLHVEAVTKAQARKSIYDPANF